MTAHPEAELVHEAPMHIEGRLAEASNITLRVQFILSGEITDHRGVYKPIKGETPLADFPDGTLAQREVAAYHISEIGGWGLIPPTVLRDGPLGLGSVQLWKECPTSLDRPAHGLLDVLPPREVPQGWLTVVEAQDQRGNPLSVIHRDDPDLASLAVLDVVLNNADRKAAHIALDGDGALWAFDHGLTGHAAPKLRTVLWGWAGAPLPDRDLARLQVLLEALEASEHSLAELLTPLEVSAVGSRVMDLLASQRFPELPDGRYPLPWPLW